MELIRNYNYGIIIRLSFNTDKTDTKEIIKELMEYKEDFDGCEVNTSSITYDFTLNGWDKISSHHRNKRDKFKLERAG